MNPARRYAIFETLRKNNPISVIKLGYTMLFELLIATLLSAQATDVGANKVTRKLFPVASIPAKLLAFGEEDTIEYVKIIGLYRIKHKHIPQTCHTLLDQYGGEVLHDRAAPEELPGAGHKIVNVVMNTTFGEPMTVVNTHIFRVTSHTGLALGKNVLRVELKLLKVVSEAFRQDAHHWPILHEYHVYKAREPEYWYCAIESLCEFRPKTPAPKE